MTDTQFEPRPFGKYFLTDRIAIGGMAEIYKAKTFGVDGFEKTLAIKKILHHYSADKEFTTMLTDEAKLVVNLSHPNIVQIYDLGRVGEDYFISMEFIDGVNLRELINRGQELNEKIPPDVCLYVASEICKGLDYAHSKRGPDGTPLEIVHRDVSPHNILVSFEGEVKIVDFGIAKAAMNLSQTQLGTLKGKVTYMSPEQAVGKPIDHRTDIFSCGILLYEMLSGERLFTGDAQLEVLNAIRNTRITEEWLRGRVPEAAVKILTHALAYTVRERYQNSADMQIDLTRSLYSQFRDFTPRRLSELLKRWYGKPSAKRAEEASFSYRSASFPQDAAQEQVNIVHRESHDDAEFSLADTLKAGELQSRDFLQAVVPSDSDAGEQPEKSGIAATSQKWDHTEKREIKLAPLSETRKPSKRRLVIGAVIACAVLLLGYVLIDLAEHSGKISGHAADSADVKLNSAPPGAKIFIDGRDTGLVTPALVKKLKLGQEYDLTLVRDGYRTLDSNILLESSKPLPLKFELKKSGPSNYVLTVHSTPPGARILLDGSDTGKTTPAEFSGLNAGEKYQLGLILSGYQEHVSSLKNDTDKDRVMDVSLSKVASATVRVDSTPPGAAIFMNGKDTGTVTPHDFSDLEVPQVVEFKLKKDGYGDAVETVGLPAGGRKALSLRLASLTEKRVIKVTVNVSGARVAVGGAEIGTAPVSVVVAPGNYVIEVVSDGYVPQSRRVEVASDDREIGFTLKPEAGRNAGKNL